MTAPPVANAEFTDEVDADALAAAQTAVTERQRWERGQQGASLKLALDNHYSPVIALRFREAGHDAVAAVERGWEREDDEDLLAICADEGRALLTDDVAGFTAICRTWAVDGRTHAGLIFTSDASMPRSRDTIGRFVEALDELVLRNPREAASQDRAHWL